MQFDPSLTMTPAHGTPEGQILVSKLQNFEFKQELKNSTKCPTRLKCILKQQNTIVKLV